MAAIDAAIERLSKTHPEHISQYGTGNELRLTGKHETCDMNTFRWELSLSQCRVVWAVLLSLFSAKDTVWKHMSELSRQQA